MTVPVTGITQPHGLEYLVEGEPAFHIRAKWERTMRRLQSSLIEAGLAPADVQEALGLTGRVAALEQDSGWVNASLTGGASVWAGAGYSAVYRKRGQLVELRLSLAVPANLAPNTVLTTLPSYVRPSSMVFMSAAQAGGGMHPGVCQVASDGKVSMSLATSSNGFFIAGTYLAG